MTTALGIFQRQRKRVFGAANPERHDFSHWDYMVRSKADPRSVCRELGIDRQYNDRNPDWCFQRFGMTRTRLSDGRVLCIAGEHEDSYDPDFCIYNDVIVLKPAKGETEVALESGEIEIYGYPESMFPPTDFHSATLVDGRILIIGNLGYPDRRTLGETPIFALDPKTYKIKPLTASGVLPGWIFRHHASYDAKAHAITVRGGQVAVPPKKLTRNFAAHRLHLDGMRWELVNARERHRRFRIMQGDGPPPFFGASEDIVRPRMIENIWLGREDHGVEHFLFDVAGVRVRFVDWADRKEVEIEGELPDDVVDQMLIEIAQNLEEASEVSWHPEELSLANAATR